MQTIGQPMVVMTLLLMSTNTIRDPADAPFASALINTPRAIAEVTGAWLLDLITRWCGRLHSSRIVDQVGQDRWRTIQAAPVLPQYPPPLLPDGRQSAPGSLAAFDEAVRQQVTVLTVSDAYLVMAALAAFLMLVLLTLPVRTLPPRIELAKH